MTEDSPRDTRNAITGQVDRRRQWTHRQHERRPGYRRAWQLVQCDRHPYLSPVLSVADRHDHSHQFERPDGVRMNADRSSFRPRSRNTRAADGERGQILVLFTIVLVVILAITALVVDLGVLRNNRQTLANAVDAGALAGGTLMPVEGASEVGAVTALIDDTVDGTYPGLTRPANYGITYKCLIGIGAGNAGRLTSPISMRSSPSTATRRPRWDTHRSSATSWAPARRAPSTASRTWATSATSSSSRATSRPGTPSPASWG